jgi:hypothetical protein
MSALLLRYCCFAALLRLLLSNGQDLTSDRRRPPTTFAVEQNANRKPTTHPRTTNTNKWKQWNDGNNGNNGKKNNGNRNKIRAALRATVERANLI